MLCYKTVGTYGLKPDSLPILKAHPCFTNTEGPSMGILFLKSPQMPKYADEVVLKSSKNDLSSKNWDIFYFRELLITSSN